MKQTQRGMSAIDLLFIVVYMGICGWVAVELFQWIKPFISWPPMITSIIIYMMVLVTIPFLFVIISALIRFFQRYRKNSPRYQARVKARIENQRRINIRSHSTQNKKNDEN